MSFTESYMMIRKSLGDMKMFGIKKFEKCGCFFLWQKEKTIVWAIALLSAHDNEGFLSEVLLSEYSSSVLYSQSEIRWKAHRFECLLKFYPILNSLTLAYQDMFKLCTKHRNMRITDWTIGWQWCKSVEKFYFIRCIKISLLAKIF